MQIVKSLMWDLRFVVQIGFAGAKATEAVEAVYPMLDDVKRPEHHRDDPVRAMTEPVLKPGAPPDPYCTM
ncbi:MAG: hypothetical protein AB7H90_04110 [Alphaproteobacteria bacterium]